MIIVKSSGSTQKIDKFLKYMQEETFLNMLDRYGAMGVDALASATPTDTGLTANSWRYEVKHKKGRHQIIWHNTNVVDGTPVAIMIQYGHGTGTGGWVEGRDFINPVILPLFDRIADEVWSEVTHA